MNVTNKWTVEINDLGKLKLVSPNGEKMRLYATEEELHEIGEKHWHKHIDIRQGEFGLYAVLNIDTYKPFEFKK